MSNSIKTYSKIRINPLNPDVDSIVITDIAHALSLMCRANGHVPEFYSVAQHCIFCAQEALARGYGNKVALACLLHDASEAYLADITRPIKPSLNNYLDIEKNLQEAIYKKYIKQDLTEDDRKKISLIDDLILHHEFIHYMDEVLNFEDTTLYSTPKFGFQDFKLVEDNYISLLNKLSSNLD